MKCPITSDKSKIEFPSLPEDEFSEVVVELTNSSSRNYQVEVVPPHSGVSGLIVNPLVKPIEAGKSILIEIKYDAKFRDLTLARMNEIFRPKIPEATVNGLTTGPRNKKLEARIKKQKEEEAKAQVVDPKAKGKALTASQHQRLKSLILKQQKRRPLRLKKRRLRSAEESKRPRPPRRQGYRPWKTPSTGMVSYGRWEEECITSRSKRNSREPSTMNG
mgnify:CR=1 FL=1